MVSNNRLAFCSKYWPGGPHVIVLGPNFQRFYQQSVLLSTCSRNVFQIYYIIRHHRYSSTSPFSMLKIVAQNLHLHWQKCKHAKERSFYVNINSNQISQKKYFKITILVFWSQIVQTRIRIIIKIIFGRLMRISVRAHCRCIHLFPNRAHDASKITCAIYNCISVHFIFGIEFFVSVFWIDLL